MLPIAIYVALILALSLFSKIAAIRTTTHLLVDPLVESADLAKIPLPHKLFDTATAALAAEGLAAKGDFAIRTGPGQSAYSRVFVDETGRIWGHLSWIATISANQVVMEYSSELASGLEIATINTKVGWGFSHPYKALSEHPRCLPLDLLLIHRKRLLDYQAAGKGPTIPQMKAAAEKLLADTQRENEAQVRAGILKRDQTGRYYYYTWYGAARAVMNGLFLLLTAKTRPGLGASETATCREGEDFALKLAPLAVEEFRALDAASGRELTWVWTTGSIYELRDGLDLYATLQLGKVDWSVEVTARSGSWQIAPSSWFTSRRAIRDAATGQDIAEFRRSGWFWSGYRGVPIVFALGGRFIWRSKFVLFGNQYEITAEDGTVLVRGGDMRVKVTADGSAQPCLELLVLIGAYLEGFCFPSD